MDYIHSYFKKYKNYSENDSNIDTHIYVYTAPETKHCLPLIDFLLQWEIYFIKPEQSKIEKEGDTESLF